MRARWAVFTVAVAALLTFGMFALLMNIAERKQEGKRLAECPCPSESCPHPSRRVE